MHQNAQDKNDSLAATECHPTPFSVNDKPVVGSIGIRFAGKGNMCYIQPGVDREYPHFPGPMRIGVRIGYFLILVLFVLDYANAQTRRIEELREKILQANSTAEEIDLSIQLADLLYTYSFDQGYKYAVRALQIAEDANYTKGVVQALTSIGNYHYFKGDNRKAIESYNRALRIAEKSDIKDLPGRTYLRLSIYYRQQAAFDSARLYLDKAKTLISFNENGSIQASYFASAGVLANELSENDTAISLLRKCISIRTHLKDTIRLADAFRNLGSVYHDVSMYDSAEYFFAKASALLQRMDNPEVRMLLNISMGETNYAKGNFSKAIENYNSALDRLKENTYRRHYAFLLYKIGELNENEGSYHIAYEYLFNAIHEFEDINARADIARSYSQIAWCYNFQENYTLALENAKKSLAIATEIGDPASISQNMNLIGYSMLKTGNFNEALSNFTEALNIRKKIKNWWGVSYSLYNIALVHIEMKNYDEGFKLLFESLAINKRIGNKSGISFTCNELGVQYLRRKEYDKAEYYLRQAQEIASSIPHLGQLMTNYKSQIKLFELKNDSRKIIQYFRLYTDLKDSLTNKINSGRMATADALFQLQKKANEIALINKENELQQEKIKNQESEIVFQKRVIMMVVIGLAVLSAMLIIIYRLLSSRTKAKEQLALQNCEIIEQKEEIQAQSEELASTNKKLTNLNKELIDKNNEIELQSEKIQEANVSLENRVAERTDQLKTAYNELETFFYKTSHDFRRPLTTYLGLVEIAKVSVKDNQAINLFEKVKETTLGLDKMLTKLQSISGIDHENSDKEIAISDLINHSLDKFSPAIQAKGIELTVCCDEAKAQINAYLCGIFLDNIIENAIDFCSPINPFIKINSSQSGKNITIIIEDNGQGIPAVVQHRVFDMYFRGSDNSKGNGLGLYVAKRAIDKLEGTISFISRLNEGTSFKITLPNNK